MTAAVELLARGDKWYLSAGDGILFAPAFPRWLDLPGYWDAATVHDRTVGPLFTVTLLDAEARELVPRALSRRWTPAELTIEYRLGGGITATEVRTVQPGGVFASEWRFAALRPRFVHLVAWTAHDVPSVELASVDYGGALTFVRTVASEHAPPLPLAIELACVGGATSWAAYASDDARVAPEWRCTPFAEKWSADGLPREVRLPPRLENGAVWVAVHRRVELSADGGAAAFAIRLVPAEPSLRGTGRGQGPVPHAATLAGTSRRRWQTLLGRAPSFRCSDPYLERSYAYRWYGLWLNAVAQGAGNFRQPTICAGPGPMHQPRATAVAAQVRELRWLDAPDLARGVLRTFVNHQHESGALPARVYIDRALHEAVHADWGDALAAVDTVWPDDAFLREMTAPLGRHAEWLLRTHDADGTGLIDIRDQREIEHGFSPRVQAIDPEGDREPWRGRHRLKGVDATVAAYTLLRVLERAAARLENPPEERRWRLPRERSGHAVATRMWDDVEDLFFDIDPITGEHTRVHAATCFLPYRTDIVRAEHVAGLERHLLDPAEFWTPYPVPSASVDDPTFSAFAEWKGVRRARPGNGRTWPAMSCRIADALAHAAVALAPRLRAPAVQLILRLVRMMFHDGDLERPNCHEHYNPFTGHASEYRGLDDVQQSWVVDLIIGWVMGVRPHDGGITIDPFPAGLEHAELLGVHARGRVLDIRIDGDRVRVTADGVSHESSLGAPIELPP